MKYHIIHDFSRGMWPTMVSPSLGPDHSIRRAVIACSIQVIMPLRNLGSGHVRLGVTFHDTNKCISPLDYLSPVYNEEFCLFLASK